MSGGWSRYERSRHSFEGCNVLVMAFAVLALGGTIIGLAVEGHCGVAAIFAAGVGAFALLAWLVDR